MGSLRHCRRAHQKLSLSSMTYSHELARAMLVEQLYRAFAILSGTLTPNSCAPKRQQLRCPFASSPMKSPVRTIEIRSINPSLTMTSISWNSHAARYRRHSCLARIPRPRRRCSRRVMDLLVHPPSSQLLPRMQSWIHSLCAGSPRAHSADGAICPGDDEVYRPGLWIVLSDPHAKTKAAMPAATRDRIHCIATNS